MTNYLTAYQQSIWKVIKAGGYLVRSLPIRARKRTRIRLLTADHRPVQLVKASCFYRLNNLDRLVQRECRFYKNPGWHGRCMDKQKNKSDGRDKNAVSANEKPAAVAVQVDIIGQRANF